MLKTVPRINLHDYRHGSQEARRHFIQTLGSGLINTGFLIVENHGVDQELTAQTYEAFKTFFNMDDASKKKYDIIAGGQRGYTPFGVEHAVGAPRPDLKEFWHVGQELAPGHPYRADYPDNVWPDEIPQLKQLTLTLYRAYEECARTLLQALADYFELPTETFSEMMREGDSICRVIHYPPLAEDAPEGAVRAAAHEDINLITLLTQAEGQGLQLLSEGEWLPVNALDGDIIVDSGDMLSRITNGIIPATTHRVVNPPDAENSSRYSMPFFVHPYAACDLSVMPRFVDEANPSKWGPITARAFLDQRLEEIGLLSK